MRASPIAWSSGQAEEIGYELHTCLLLSDAAGNRWRPSTRPSSRTGLTSSRRRHTTPWPAGRTNLDALAGTIDGCVHQLALGRVAVHVIDAEADSVAHFRPWAKRGHLFLVRVKGTRQRVLHAGQNASSTRVVRQLQGRFVPSREVLFHGRPGATVRGPTEVVLYRPAKPQRQGRPRAAAQAPRAGVDAAAGGQSGAGHRGATAGGIGCC